MSDPLLVAQLPLVQRLALTYAPARARAPTLALLALDSRLAGVVRASREPMLGQLRLSWWRDLLGTPPQTRPAGEPLVAALASWGGNAAGLAPLVDGWEALLGADAPDGDAITALSVARGSAFAALGDLLGNVAVTAVAARAAHGWSLADLGTRLTDPAARRAALDLARQQDWQTPGLPRCLRPLSVLHGLARRWVRHASEELLDGPMALGAVVRLGLVGR